jgi:hypothetical protein
MLMVHAATAVCQRQLARMPAVCDADGIENGEDKFAYRRARQAHSAAIDTAAVQRRQVNSPAVQ